MTDERAIELLKLIEEYARASIKEGGTLAEVAGWTIGQTVEDIIDTTPTYLEHEIGGTARELYELAGTP